MPDATTAGVQSGVALTPYTGPMTVTANNVVIENAIINDTLRVTGDNVIIRNCLVQNWGWWGIDGEGAANIRIEHCDFIGPNGDTNAAIVGSGTFVGNDIRNSENGIVLQDGASVVRDNYIHDLNDPIRRPAHRRHFRPGWAERRSDRAQHCRELGHLVHLHQERFRADQQHHGS